MNGLALRGADPLVLETHVASVPLEQALLCLARQPELAAPAKLAIGGHGDAELIVELTRGLDTREAIACAASAVERARQWLAGAPREAASAGAQAALEEALCELDWSSEPTTDGAFRAGVELGPSPANLRVEALAGDQLRVSQEALLPLRSAELRTLARFGLEVNRRLRFARLSIAGGGTGHARAVWDAVMPAWPSPAAALGEAAAAVVCARADTWGGLRALRHASVSQAFERLRS